MKGLSFRMVTNSDKLLSFFMTEIPNPYHIETSSRTGFYMIGTSVMNILKATSANDLFQVNLKVLRQEIDQKLTNSRSSHRRCSVKKAVLKTSQCSQKTPVFESLFNKACNFKRDSNTGVFLWILRIFLRTHFSRDISGSLLL